MLAEWYDPIIAFVTEHFSRIALALTWLGVIWVWFRRRRDWKSKAFLNQVNFSLNYVEDGRLRLRTLLEDSAEQVWLNKYGVNLVLKAAGRATVDQPFLSLRNADDMAYILRAVLNVLSEKFADVYVARSLGAPVVTGNYVFGITCEKYGAIRTHKLRVIVMRQEDLQELFADSDREQLAVEAPAHRDRLTTLKVMHRLLSSDKPRDRATLDIAELGVPMSRGAAPLSATAAAAKPTAALVEG